MIPVRQASALPTVPFRLSLTEESLSVQLIVPLTGPIKDLHLQEFVPCRAHIKKGSCATARPLYIAKLFCLEQV